MVFAAVVWVGVRGLMAKAELESARALLGPLKSQAASFDIRGATASLAEVHGHTEAAVGLTSDPIWRASELLPWVGANLTAGRELAATTDAVVSNVVTPLMVVASNVNPASLAPNDGVIDLQPFLDAIPAIARATAEAKDVAVEFGSIDVNGTIPQVVAAHAQVEGLLNEVAPLLETLDVVVRLIPPALGSETPRTYVVMFQNNAESRALGGTALSFAVVNVDQGRIDLSATIPAGFKNFTQYEGSVIPVPDGVAELHPTFGKFIADVTVRPSFASAAEATQEMWIREFGNPVDGIISVDPVALSYVLMATGPITLSTGDTLDSSSLVPLLLNKVYQRFNSGDPVEDNRLQDVVYGEAVDATFDRLMHGPLKPELLLRAITQAVSERRVLLWSAFEAEQSQLAGVGMHGGLPQSDDLVERVGVYFQDNVGAKLNYYLKQSVRLSQASCGGDGVESYRASAELTNTLRPADVPGLSQSIVGNWAKEGLRPGVQRMFVMLYAPPGSQILRATVNGAPVPLSSLHDTEYPVAKVLVAVEPGSQVSVSYDFRAAEPGAKTLEAEVTPMVNPTDVAVESLECSTTPVG